MGAEDMTTDRVARVRQLQQEIADLASLSASDPELEDAYQELIEERREALLRLLRGEDRATMAWLALEGHLHAELG
jgi:hypothetical protein